MASAPVAATSTDPSTTGPPNGQPSSAAGSHQAASEIAWKFVVQYYKYMNKEPTKLHCFYTKRSTLIHGTEGEETAPCYGQHEIHSRIMSLNFDECKVFVHNVDSQSSAEGGIVIQVIGELQHAAEASLDIWHKFTQTFFLAEQPNGYFVLNDIFRYIREESAGNDVDAEDANPDDVPPATTSFEAVGAGAADQAVEEVEQPQVNGVHPVAEEELVPEPSAPEPVVEVVEPSPVPTPEPEPTPVPEPTSAEAPAAAEPTPPAAPASPSPAPSVDPSPAPVSQPAAASPAPASTSAPSAAPSSTPASQPPSTAAAAASKPADAPTSRPSKPMNWASLAAGGAGKWGAQMAENRGVSSNAPTTSTSSSTSAAPAQSAQPPTANGAGASAQSQSQASASTRTVAGTHYDVTSINTGSTFIKGVVETISDEALKETLERDFGPTAEISIVRTKACAFVDFVSVKSARDAVAASHLKGGIVITGASEPRRKVYIEEKKEKGTAGRGGRTDPANRDNPAFQTVRGGASGARGTPARGAAPARGRGQPTRATGTPAKV